MAAFGWLSWTAPRFLPVPAAGLDGLAARGVEVVTPDRPVALDYGTARITADPPDPADADADAPILAGEFDLYPDDFLRRVRLRRVVLCAGLRLDGEPAAGVPDLDAGIVYLDAGALRADPAAGRQTVHHELFHLADWRDNGVIDRDPAWEALNPAGFRYAGGGKAALADPAISTAPSDRVPGFLNTYSTTAVEEDKAEVFGWLMTNPGYMAKHSAERDPVIAAKVARMKALVNRFCPALDDDFWAGIAASPGPAGPGWAGTKGGRTAPAPGRGGGQ